MLCGCISFPLELAPCRRDAARTRRRRLLRDDPKIGKPGAVQNVSYSHSKMAPDKLRDETMYVSGEGGSAGARRDEEIPDG